MFFIHSLLQQLVPEWIGNRQLSVACLCTTNPIYLVFNEQDVHPSLVVRMADSESVYHSYKVSERLFPVVGKLVVEPVKLSEFCAHRVAIEKGLKGMPWFQLASHFSTFSQWEELRVQALNALHRLGEGTRSFSDWVTVCHPGEQLRQCYQQCLESGTTLSAKVHEQVNVYCEELDSIGPISTHCQHGDYCLNNLLIEKDQVHIIDFEDFGMTSMPFHDEFALALSMYLQAPKHVSTTLRHEVTACTAEGLKHFNQDSSVLPGFFMHHLLLRLGEWSNGSRRTQYRIWLLSLIEEFAQDPGLYFET